MRPVIYSVNPSVYPPCGGAGRLLLCVSVGGQGSLAWVNPLTGAWVTAALPTELVPSMIQGQLSIGGWPVDPVIDAEDLADTFPDIPTPVSPVPRLRPSPTLPPTAAAPRIPIPDMRPTSGKVSANKAHTVTDVVTDRTACDTGVGGNHSMTLETTTDAAHHHRFYDNHNHSCNRDYGISDKDAVNEASRHQVSVAERFETASNARTTGTDKLIVDSMRDASRDAAHLGERIGDKVCSAIGAVDSSNERRWDTSILYNQGVAVAAETARRESLAQGCTLENAVRGGDASVIQALTSGFGAVALGVATNTASIQKSLCEMATALTGTMNTGFTSVALAQAVADKNREVSEKNLIIYSGDKFGIQALAAQNLASAQTLEAQKNFAALFQQAAQLAAISDAKAAECCCEIKERIAAQSCDLKERIHAEGEATRSLIQTNELAELRARLARALPAPAPAL
jgi:hypothetical protein